jgi:hypothetical protein
MKPRYTAWKHNTVKPVSNDEDYNYDIEIIEEGERKTRIIRNCRYVKKFNYFEEYGTNEIFNRFEIHQYRKEIKN